MRRKIRSLASFAVALILMLCVFALTAQAVVLDAYERENYVEYLGLTGVLTGRNAPFRLVVPDDWNGTLLVYARGTGTAILVGVSYDPSIVPVVVGVTPLTNVPGSTLGDNHDTLALEAELRDMGYALCASDYKPDERFIDHGLLSWVVEDGIHDTLELTHEAKSILNENHGRFPVRTILWGRSQGSIVALKLLEEEPALYDGVITGSTVGAGAPRIWDTGIDFALAYDVAFKVNGEDRGGWPEAWGSVGDVNDDIIFGGFDVDGNPDGDVLPVLLSNLGDNANFGRFEFVRLVNGLPYDGFYPFQPGFETFNWLFADMLFVTEVRGDLEWKAGGPVGENDGHVYSLTEEEKQYLAGLGINADDLLADMNARTDIEAEQLPRNYVEENAEFSGDISRPVISMHTKTDGLVIPANESAYRETVEAAGKSDLLVQVFTDAVGHCTFTSDQWLATVAAMKYWLDTERQPGQKFFSPKIGFDNNFTPPAWPQP